MPNKARVYIGCAILVGTVLLARCLWFACEFPDNTKYIGYLSLACIGSSLKIRLPKIRGTMSINFLFILMGIMELTLVETMVLGGVAALVQCLWRPRRRPTLVQVLFNVSTLVTSIALAYSLSHNLVQHDNLPVLLAVAVCAYFVANTGMVSLVLCLTEERPLVNVWRQCYLWSFPYYLVGASIAGMVTYSSRTLGWKPSLMILPLMYLVYSYYRVYLSYQTQQDHGSV
jgi:hypothetical protein